MLASGAAKITTSQQTLDIAAPVAIDARVVVVCRRPWGDSREDVAIDAISAICR